MRRFALSAIGRDRPGIVAAVAERLVAHDVNIEDSQMAILRGQFSMVLVVGAPDAVDAQGVRFELEAARDRLGLAAIAFDELDDDPDAPTGAPTHIVSVYGADHPGIVAAVATALAACAVNIVDLETRLVGEEDRPLYVMVVEVSLPDGMEADQLDALLDAVREGQGVEVTVGVLDQDQL